MTAEIEKFDPNQLMNGVRDRIKSEFVNMIPDSAWSDMIQAEIDNFMKAKTDRYGNITPSEFHKLVHEELQLELKRQITLFFESERWKTEFNEFGQPKISAAIEEFMLNNADLTLKSMFGSAFQSMANSINFAMQNVQIKPGGGSY